MNYLYKYKKYKQKYKFEKFNYKHMQYGAMGNLKILTYNVFSGTQEKFSFERMNPTINLIKELNPDIICLQEATSEFISLLNSENKYHIFSKLDYLLPNEKIEVEKSGYLVILSIYPFIDKKLVYQGGYHDDGILKVNINLENKLETNIFIYNVHLSGGTYDKPTQVILEKRIRRMLELDILNQDIKNTSNCIIVGDFNSDANSEELFPAQTYEYSETTLRIFPEVRFYPSRQINGIIDVWNKLRPNDLGNTEDTEKNTFRKYIKKNQIRQARYDQVYYRENNYFHPQQIDLIGTNTVNKIEGIDIFPSDHFGLLVTFITK